MIERVRGFLAFWYDFIIGDDWRVAVGVVLALGVTAVVGRAGVSNCWVLPAAVAVLLPMSVWRAARRRGA